MSTAETEQPPPPPRRRRQPLTPYERLVKRVTTGHWRIEDEQGSRRFTENDIRARLEEGGLTPGNITKLNLADAFRLVTEHTGVRLAEDFGRREGKLTAGRPRMSKKKSRRHTTRHK